MAMPSPFPIYANFFDWIFAFTDDFINGDRYSYAYSNQFASNFNSKMKDNLICFEEHVRNHFRKVYPNISDETHRIIFKPCNYIFLDKATRETFDLNVERLLHPLVQWPIVGSFIREEHSREFRIEQSEERSVTLRVTEVVLNAAESRPTGLSNLTIPEDSLSKNKIYKSDVPQGSEFADFMGFHISPQTSTTDLTIGAKNTISSNEEMSKLRSLMDDKNTGNLGAEADSSQNKAIKIPYADGDEDSEVKIQPKGEPVVIVHEPIAVEGTIGKENFTIDYEPKSLALRISIDNLVGPALGMAFRFIPKEKCNVFLPVNQINKNFKKSNNDIDAIFLTKVCPELPYGNFDIEVVHKDIEEKFFHRDNQIYLADGTECLTFSFRDNTLV